MAFAQISNIIRENNIITMNLLNHSKCTSDFLVAVKDAIRLKYEEIIIRCSAHTVFPNACVPIAGVIQHYQRQGIGFIFEIPQEHYLLKCGFINPYDRERNELQREPFPFDKIFLYQHSGQVADITQSFINAISHQSICEDGVLHGLSWCINEVMDNVLVHSNSSYGLVMAQYHSQAKHVVFCVHDSGIGIYNSLRESSHKPKTEIDALSLAMQEGVGDGKGQGNGLFGLYQIVHRNSGRLTITSGASSIMLFNNSEINKFERIPFISYGNRGTTVDFQIDLNKPIDIKDAFSSIGGFDGFDIRIDNMLDDDDYVWYDVFDNGQGTATREAGAYLRNDIINILRRSNSCMVLDFKKVQTVSSSFIDELIAKMVLELGFVKFNSAIRMIAMNEEVQFLCERSLYMRIHKAWQEK